MRNPLYRLKMLPWRSLFQAAVLTGLVVLVLDFVLNVVVSMFPIMGPILGTLFSPPLGILIVFAIAIGVGALSVIFLERIDRPEINTSSLWALVLCLIIVFLIRSLLPPPVLLIEINYFQVVALAIGVFWRARPYWQSFRRW